MSGAEHGDEGLTRDRTVLPIGLLLAIASVGVTLEPGLGNDAWWHLALGRWTVEHAAIPLAEPFPTLRAGAEWVRSGWLADVGMFRVYRLAGPAGLRMATSLIIALAVGISVRRAGGSMMWRVALGSVLVLAVAAAAVPRPLVLALPMIAFAEWVLDRENRSATWWLWTLPFLAVVWVNVHGSFPLLIVVLGIDVVAAWTDRSRRARLLIASSASTAALLLNPFGWRILHYPLDVQRLAALQQIEEWQPTITTWPEALVYLALILACIAGFATGSMPRSGRVVLRVALFSILGALAVRNLPLAALVLVPLIAVPHGKETSSWPRSVRERAMVAAVLGLIAGMVLVVGNPALATSANERAIAQRQPVEAVDQLLASGELMAAERIYHPYEWGGYLLWRSGGQARTFVDSRTELFGDDLIRDSRLIAITSDGWQGALDRSGVDLVLTGTNSPLADDLTDRWPTLHRDDVATVFQRP